MLKTSLSYLLLFVFLCQSKNATAQCGIVINSFPYWESFENDNGGWTVGGNASDWEWGTPTKSVISSAAEGTKCWTTGGLAGTGYNVGEQSWLLSPCFDLTSLVNPRVVFKFNCDTKRSYDGASFEYSVNGGQWTKLGSAFSPLFCDNVAWFTHPDIQYLNASAGWSGTTIGWTKAIHSLAAVLSASNVRFRFTFGAGTAPNALDGFAFDDFSVEETPLNITSFNYLCTQDRQVAFTSSSTNCPNGFLWNFGDPASGSNNTSTLQNPEHVFSTDGSYVVTLTAFFSTGPSAVIVQTIKALDVRINITSPVKCNGDTTGAITVQATGGTGVFDYFWDITPLQTTPSISNIPAGLYSVTVLSADACETKAQIKLQEPAPLSVVPHINNAQCGSMSGSIYITATGGTTPYSYNWSNGIASQNNLHLFPGRFGVEITDSNGCKASANNIEIININRTIPVYLGKDITTCPDDNPLILHPGIYKEYLWQDNSTATFYPVRQSGNYKVEVVDSFGCRGSAEILVTIDCRIMSFPSAFSPNNDGKNELYGPVGNLYGLSNYSFMIFNRAGQKLFSTNDPFQQWDGRYKGSPLERQALVWHASYIKKGVLITKKGTVLLLH